MRKYGCFQAIIKSFYSRDLYRDVVANWNVGVILYILLVLSICWVLLAVQIQRVVNVHYEEFSTKFYPQIPEMTIKNGELTTPEKRPYLIKDPKKDAVVAIIDTSGKYQTLDKSSAEILVTKHAIFYQNKSKLGRSHEFDSDLNLEIKPVQLESKLKIIFNWMWILVFPVFILVSFTYRIVQSALYAIIGEIFAHILKIPLTYGEIFKISIFAITPAIIIGTLLDWFSISFPHMWLFYFILSMGYLWFGIAANKKQ